MPSAVVGACAAPLWAPRTPHGAGTGQLVIPGVLAIDGPLTAASLRFSPDGRFAYAPSESEEGQVRAFAVASNGRLTEISGSPFGTKSGSNSNLAFQLQLSIHPSGKLVFLGTSARTTLTARAVVSFKINSVNGSLQLVERSPAPVGEKGGIVLAGTDRAWVQLVDGRWALEVIDAQTGQLAAAFPGVSVSIGANWEPVVNANGKVLITTETSGSRVHLQSYTLHSNSNTLTAVGPGLDVNWGSVIPDPTGDFFRINDLVLSVDASQGVQVRAISQVPAPTAVVTGTHAATLIAHSYALDMQAGRVRILDVNPATGALVASGSIEVSGRPVALAVEPLWGFVAVASVNGISTGTLSVLRIDRATGLLQLAGSISLGMEPTAVAIGNDGRTVYLSHVQGIDAFRVDAIAGSVQRVAGSPFPTGFSALTFSFVDGGGVRISSETPVVDKPAADLLSGGGVLFVATNKGSLGEVSTLGEGTDGSLGAIHTGQAACAVGLPAMGSTFSAAGSGTAALGMAGDGRLVYAVNRDSGTVAGFRAVGGLCFGEAWMPAITGSPFATGTLPIAIAVDPSGRFAYIANSAGTGSISAYTISPVSGKLSPVSGSPFPIGRVPAKIWTDALGRYLYTSDAAGAVTVQTIDRTTGQLGVGRSALSGLAINSATDAVMSVR